MTVSTGDSERLIKELQDSYASYLAALGKVINGVSVTALIDALNHKHANPIAKALGLMMPNPEAHAALPVLLDWLIVQSPMYSDVLEALVRSKDAVLPLLVERLDDASIKDDDEAVRNLLDLGSKLEGESLKKVIDKCIDLAKSKNEHVREAAVDALWRIALPEGARAAEILLTLANSDPSDSVRKASKEALARLGYR